MKVFGGCVFEIRLICVENVIYVMCQCLYLLISIYVYIYINIYLKILSAKFLSFNVLRMHNEK